MILNICLLDSIKYMDLLEFMIEPDIYHFLEVKNVLCQDKIDSSELMLIKQMHYKRVIFVTIAIF